MPPSRNIEFMAKHSDDDLGNISRRKATALYAAHVGNRVLNDHRTWNPRQYPGYITEGVGKGTHVSRSRDEGKSVSRRGNERPDGFEFGGRRRSRKHRKTRKHKKTHRRR
jgi:hypothetical protein